MAKSNGSGNFARAQVLSLTVLFSGSDYVSGEDNKNRVLVSILFEVLLKLLVL